MRIIYIVESISYIYRHTRDIDMNCKESSIFRAYTSIHLVCNGHVILL